MTTIESIIRDRSKDFVAKSNEDHAKRRVIFDIALDKDMNPAEDKSQWAYIMSVEVRTLGLVRSGLLNNPDS